MDVAVLRLIALMREDVDDRTIPFVVGYLTGLRSVDEVERLVQLVLERNEREADRLAQAARPQR